MGNVRAIKHEELCLGLYLKKKILLGSDFGMLQFILGVLLMAKLQTLEYKDLE